MASEWPDDRRAQAAAVLDALNARDFDALADMPFHPAMEFRSVVAAAEGAVYHGVPGLREWAANVDSIFDRFENEILEVREVDDERAVVVVRVTGTARASGIPLDTRLAQVWTWRDGKLWRNEVFSNPAEAFEAVGLAGR